jgi:hypothetical protein
MSFGHRTRGHSHVLFWSKNIDIFATLPTDIRGHVPTCPWHDICVSYLKKIGHALKGHFHRSPLPLIINHINYSSTVNYSPTNVYPPTPGFPEYRSRILTSTRSCPRCAHSIKRGLRLLGGLLLLCCMSWSSLLACAWRFTSTISGGNCHGLVVVG